MNPVLNLARHEQESGLRSKIEKKTKRNTPRKKRSMSRGPRTVPLKQEHTDHRGEGRAEMANHCAIPPHRGGTDRPATERLKSEGARESDLLRSRTDGAGDKDRFSTTASSPPPPTPPPAERPSSGRCRQGSRDRRRVRGGTGGMRRAGSGLVGMESLGLGVFLGLFVPCGLGFLGVLVLSSLFFLSNGAHRDAVLNRRQSHSPGRVVIATFNFD
jgi:hypothetical protein